jgi:diacylglycerol kinase family enzyme
MNDAGVDVIVNRKAKRLLDGRSDRGARGVVRAIARAATGGAAAPARVHETSDLDQLAEVARAIADRGTDAVVLAGGDGSAMAGLSALARAYGGRALPPIGLAPGGNVCTVARNLGVSGSAAGRVVRAARAGTARATAQATLRVRDDAGGDRVGFIFGAGLVVRFFDAYYAAPDPGLAAAASLVARIFAGSFTGGALATQVLTPTPCTLRVDGETRAGRAWSLVLASTVRDVGLHMLVPYRAGQATDRVHAVASGLPARALAAQLPRVLRGRPLVGEPRVDALVKSLRVSFEDGGGYVLDGDVFRARAVSVEPGPVLQMLLP